MLDAFKPLPDDPAKLKGLVSLMGEEIKSQTYQIEKLKGQLAAHQKARFGSKSETLDQLAFDLSEDKEIEAAAEAQKQDDPAHGDAPDQPTKRKHSRKPLPDHLDRVDEVLSPGEACSDCGGNLRQLGEDVTEELEYIPGRFVVRRIVRPRMACTCCEAFSQAPLPSRPIERGRPGPGLLAHVLVSKYCDHLPLARQSHIYAREKVDLHRSTLTDWVGRSTALLEPLADHIGKLVRAGPALFADDTPVKLQTKTKIKKAKTARLWSYVRDERPWQGQAPPCAWYQFSVDRKGEHPVNHLSGYTGTVHADGYAGFNGLFGENKADEQACMVHVRRKFVDVYEAQGSAVAKEVIERIADLYAVEKEARGQSPEERGGLRQTKAKPIFDDLESWLQLQLPKISGKTSLAQAIRYALGRMPKARAYLSNGMLELDNNICERSIRPIALGRKNYLFMGSIGGGKAAATAYTSRLQRSAWIQKPGSLETAKMNGVDPEAWLMARLSTYGTILTAAPREEDQGRDPEPSSGCSHTSLITRSTKSTNSCPGIGQQIDRKPLVHRTLTMQAFQRYLDS